jgi:5'(3')-deoxyribonucleotidase
MKKIIAIDVDNVLFQINTMDYVNRVLGTNYREEDFTDWEMNNLPKDVQDAAIAAWQDVRFMCYESKAIAGNHQILRKWNEQGHYLYAVTSRHNGLILDTVAQINNVYPGIFGDRIVFVNDGSSKRSSKAKHFKKIGANVVIDDWYVEDGISVGAKTVLITNEKTPYNHSKRTNQNLYQALSLCHARFE